MDNTRTGLAVNCLADWKRPRSTHLRQKPAIFRPFSGILQRTSFSVSTFVLYCTVIDTDEKVAGFLPKLRDAKWVALDTEADSLHAYPEKLCLIQVSIEGHDELVDPLSTAKLEPLFDTLKPH